MNYSRHRKLLLLVSGCLLSVCFTNAAHAQTLLSVAPLNEPLTSGIAVLPLDKLNTSPGQAIKNQLQAKVQQTGSVRLIVTLRTPAQPEHLLNTSQLDAQRNNLLVAQDAFTKRIAGYGGTFHTKFDTVPVVVIDANAVTLDHLLNQSPDVKSIREDVLMKFSLMDSVPLIGGDKAWAAGFAGEGQVIAILDSGVKSTHPFLTGKVVHEACFSTPGEGTLPNGTKYILKSTCPNGEPTQFGAGAGEPSNLLWNYHGTYVAGVAAGTNPTFSGVAKGAKIMSINIAVNYNSADMSLCPPHAPYPAGCLVGTMSDNMKAAEYVYTQRNNFKIAAVNISSGVSMGMSIGVGGELYSAPCDDEPMKAIIDNLRSAGIATIAASGNQGSIDSLEAPACISSAISVGGSHKIYDQVDDYSNSASFLNLLAPGSVVSSVFGLEYAGIGDYASFGGTSAAAPHVAGAWAVLKSKKPEASVTEILDALTSTGKPLTDSRNQITKPRIQVDAALDKLVTTSTTSTTTTTSSTTSTTVATACYTTSNTAHVKAGRATARYHFYVYAKGSNQFMGYNFSFYTTKLRQTGVNYYVIDTTCP